MKNGTYVWDLLVRLFHWSLVALFTLSYLTGDEWETVHVYSGYAILVLILIRVIWGFVGSKHARFSDFVRPVPEAIGYLKSLLSGTAKKYTGHNPAGGLMVLALLSSIAITGVTGLKAYGEEGHGPLAKSMPASSIETRPGETMINEPLLSSEDPKGIHTESVGEIDDEDEAREHEAKEHDEEDELWKELHEFFANFTVLLVILHVLGVYVSASRHKENLVKAMITGYKE